MNTETKPTTKKQVHNLIILDESGSMDFIKSAVIKGFNEIVETMQIIAGREPEQEHLISMVSFNGAEHKTHHWKENVLSLEKLNTENYRPGASTPLLDAMGFSLTRLRNELEGNKDYHVLVTVFTDGEENASQEYTGTAIKQLVEELKQGPWTFTYIGTDHDVHSFSARISINNVIMYNKTDKGVNDYAAKERSSRMRFNEELKKNNLSKNNYYANPEGEEDDDFGL